MVSTMSCVSPQSTRVRRRSQGAGACVSAADRCVRMLSVAGTGTLVGHHAGGLRPPLGGDAGLAGADLCPVWDPVSGTSGQPEYNLLGLPAVSAAPVSAVRLAPCRSLPGPAPGGLQRLPACPLPSGIRDMALKRTVLRGRSRDPGCRCRAVRIPRFSRDPCGCDPERAGHPS